MSKAMDEWDILSTQKVPIKETDKTGDIFKKFEKIWPELLINTLKWILNWEIKAVKQNNSKATYCSKIEKQDWEINFHNSAKSIYDKFRAYTPWPWIYTYYKWKKFSIEECSVGVPLMGTQWLGCVIKLENKNIWIICWEWILILKQIKLEWKKTMDINSFINWNKDFLEYKF